jgi:hypothetical protein
MCVDTLHKGDNDDDDVDDENNNNNNNNNNNKVLNLASEFFEYGKIICRNIVGGG